jgi:ABC-type transport system involved in cytochrome c biogenesis ATPase subunit
MDAVKKRALFSTILRHLAGSEAIVITGLRQVGKTTLMRQVYEICAQIGSGIRFVLGGRQRVCGRCKDEIDAIKKRGAK